PSIKMLLPPDFSRQRIRIAMNTVTLNRRQFLAGASASAAMSLLPRLVSSEASRRLKVAAVFTEFTYRSHAHVIIEHFLEPYYFTGQVTDSGCDVVSFFGDQFPESEMARDVAKAYQIPIYSTIAGALTLGGQSLAVDAVLSIGEHGTYPRNEKGQ